MPKARLGGTLDPNNFDHRRTTDRPAKHAIKLGRLLIGFLAMLLFSQAAFALNPALKLSQYHHTSWAGKEGAPTEVTGLAEVADGHLWLATPEGLLQFDGLTFERIKDLGGDSAFNSEIIRSLCADPNGGVWLSFGQDHGAALYKDGHLTRFKGRTVTRCIAVEGATWLVSDSHLARYKDGQIEDIGEKWGVPPIVTRFVTVDKSGSVLALDAKSLGAWYLRKGESRFRKFEGEVPALANVTAPDGSIWGAASVGLAEITMINGTPTKSRWLSHKNMSLLLFDRDGGFWATDLDGLIHVGDPNRIRNEPDGPWREDDVMTVDRGLSADVVWCMIEDKNGNVWLGTAAGLERFRDSALIPVKVPGRALANMVAATADGSVWAANWTSQVWRVDRSGVVQTIALDSKEAYLNISHLHVEQDGSLLVAAQGHTIWRVDKIGPSLISTVPMDMSGTAFQSISRDLDGNLWAAFGRWAPVIMNREGKWSRPVGRGLPTKWYSNYLMADSAGRVWVAQQKEVILVEGDHGSTLSKASNGLDVGDIRTMYQHNGDARVWVGGSSGIAVFDGQRFHTLQLSGDFVPSQVSGIAQSSNGDLWIHGRSDGFKVEASELKRFYERPDVPVAARHFDALDGLTGITRVEIAQPSLVEDRDGLIWFSSTTGLSYFDPRRIANAQGMPPVQIKSISTKTDIFRAGSLALTLPPLSRTISIEYTALDLGMPERIRFKYKLDGVDKSWQESGTRRVAQYSDLGPGVYQFHVLSTDARGTWGTSEATLEVTVPPAWFQTWPFRALVLVLTGTLLWLIYKTRVAQLTARVRWQLRTQQAERDRIARDLHDTLLQGIQGLIWRFHTLAAHLGEGDPVRHGMETALDTADEMLERSRDRVQDLRGAIGTKEPLMEQLQEFGSSLAIDHPASFAVSLSGQPRDINSNVQDEICFIAREALSNAFAHAAATSITVVIAFSDRELTVSVADDGRGVDPSVLEAGRPKHFGLLGMRERAAVLGANFSFVSSPQRGTTVSVEVASLIAYEFHTG